MEHFNVNFFKLTPKPLSQNLPKTENLKEPPPKLSPLTWVLQKKLFRYRRRWCEPWEVVPDPFGRPITATKNPSPRNRFPKKRSTDPPKRFVILNIYLLSLVYFGCSNVTGDCYWRLSPVTLGCSFKFTAVHFVVFISVFTDINNFYYYYELTSSKIS